MTDRDLLELAAKAAGIPTSRLDAVYDCWDKQEAPVLIRSAWNPLTDDGDAFRLAVKLRLQPRQGINLVSVTRPDGGWNDENYRDHNNNHLAATRRAIVCAAAEIGRAMS